MKLENLTFDEIYLIFVNDFLTIETMAQYYNVHPDLLKLWLDCGKATNNSTAEDWEELLFFDLN